MKDRIRDLMESLHKSQQEFAQMIEMSPASLSSIFNGRTKPTLNIVEAIKKKIPDISIEWLMFGQGSMYQNTEGKQAAEQQPTPTDNEPVWEFDFDDPAPAPKTEKQPEKIAANANSVKHTRLETRLSEVKTIDTPKRHVVEIRVYYDDQTFETFVPAKH